MGGYSIGGIIYILIGVALAVNHGYFIDIGTISGILSALLAILLWPLLLVGINLHVTI
jgi:hypothetical protein